MGGETAVEAATEAVNASAAGGFEALSLAAGRLGLRMSADRLNRSRGQNRCQDSSQKCSDVPYSEYDLPSSAGTIIPRLILLLQLTNKCCERRLGIIGDVVHVRPVVQSTNQAARSW